MDEKEAVLVRYELQCPKCERVESEHVWSKPQNDGDGLYFVPDDEKEVPLCEMCRVAMDILSWEIAT